MMAEKRDYYEVLGVERNAESSQISEAYRKLAMKYHPDRNPGDEEAVVKFKEAAEAFEVLSHTEKRARYDRYGLAGVENGGGPHFHDVSDIFSAFGDIFGEGFFGGIFGQGTRAIRGADIRCDVTIDLMEAANGATKVIRFMRHAQCETCKGVGAKPGTQPELCRYCGGRGRVVQQSGFFSLQTTCPACHGAGQKITDPCNDCHGSGYVQTKVTRKVNIPAGVDDHTRLRLQGEGEPSAAGGPHGDCYVSIRVLEHPMFIRRGQDLFCDVPVSYTQAALGAMIEVPTLDGRLEMRIPAGSQSGEEFILKGRGMPDPRRRGRGNLHVRISIEVPRSLSAEHEAALRQLAEIENAHVTPSRKSFFDKLKELFGS